jgi:hypothetical protein
MGSSMIFWGFILYSPEMGSTDKDDLFCVMQVPFYCRPTVNPCYSDGAANYTTQLKRDKCILISCDAMQGGYQCWWHFVVKKFLRSYANALKRYNYHNFGHHPSSCPRLAPSTGPIWVVSTWRRRQNLVSKRHDG